MLREKKPRYAPELARIIARVAVGGDAGRRQRRQRADLVALIIVEAAVGAKKEILVDCVDGGQTRGAYWRRDRRRQRFRPAVDVDDRALARQPREQVLQRPRRRPVPRALNGGGGAGGIAEQIVLAQADHLDAGLNQPRVDGRRSGEQDRPRAAPLEAERAFDRDLSLTPGHRGVIDADHDGHRFRRKGHGARVEVKRYAAALAVAA